MHIQPLIFQNFPGGHAPYPPRMASRLRHTHSCAWGARARVHNLKKVHFFHLGPPNHFFGATLNGLALRVEGETNSVPLVSKLFYLRPNGIENVTVTNIKRKILFYGIFYTYF